MNETTYYYSLKFKGSSEFYNNGDVINCASDAMTIGEVNDCDIKYPREDSRYEPEYYATILKNDDGKSWRILSRSHYVTLETDRTGVVKHVTNLVDGDVITFGNQRQQLYFKVHHDELLQTSGMQLVPKSNMKIVYSLMAILFAGLIIGGLWLKSNMPKDIVLDEVSELENSVFLIKVDSVQFIQKTKEEETLIGVNHMDNQGKPTGTAFLADNGKLITARHCVEYWLGENIEPTTRINNLSEDDIVRWAAEMETYNYEHEGNDTCMVMRSFCSVYAHDNITGVPVFSFSSTDDSVHINRNHDAFIVLDDFVNRYWWRTITPYFSLKTMELGDIVYVDTKNKGLLQLADSADIMDIHREAPLAFLGFPENQNGDQIFFASGNLKAEPLGYSNDYAETTTSLLVHSGELTHGNSGGPVIARRKGGGLVVIGVVSKVDNRNDGLKMSVPITEINSK